MLIGQYGESSGKASNIACLKAQAGQKPHPPYIDMHNAAPQGGPRVQQEWGALFPSPDRGARQAPQGGQQALPLGGIMELIAPPPRGHGLYTPLPPARPPRTW